MKNFITAFMLMALMALSACKNPGSVESNGIPKTLIIGVVETEKIDQIKKVREQVRQYLQEKLGMPVQMVFTNDYTGVIEALKSNKVHMAELPPFAYVIATRSMHLTPIVTLGTNGKPTTYQSVLIVKGGSTTTLANLKERAKNLTLGFVDPASTSGHLIPRAFLNSIGLNPDTAFKQTIFAGSHSAVALSVKSGKIDVGATTDLIFGLMTKAKMLNEGDVKVIWKSVPIVSDPIVVRSDLNKDFVKKIQDAYLSLDKEHPEILAVYTKLFFRDTLRRGYIPAQDSMYEGLRKIANSVKDLKAN